MGQMDAASRIFDYLYLGTEWNASNEEELQQHEYSAVQQPAAQLTCRSCKFVINVTKEIRNFFPDKVQYFNIKCLRPPTVRRLTLRRVYDVPNADLLHHWEDTYRFIRDAKFVGRR